MSRYDEVMAKLTEMESRFNSGFLSSDKDLLASLHNEVFGKPIQNLRCNDCYRDAYIMLVNKFKQKKTMPKKSNYVLKNGALIHPFGTSQYYTNPLSDEVAEEFLSKDRKNIKLFASYPEDWSQRVDAYENKKRSEVSNAKPAGANKEVSELNAALKDAESRAEELKSLADELEAKLISKEENESVLMARIAELEQEKANIDATSEASDEAPDLSGVVSELEEKVAALEQEKATLKAENRALKAANTRLKKASAEETEAENKGSEA